MVSRAEEKRESGFVAYKESGVVYVGDRDAINRQCRE